MIRLAQPAIDAPDIEAVATVLRSGWLVQAEQVRAFEQELASLGGVPHAVAVSSGTAALHLAVLALGLRPGDEVAIAAFSWPATANVAVMAGLVPRFVDIGGTGMAMDPPSFEALTTRHKIKAVLPVHPLGNTADMPAIVRIAAARGIPVIEDAACAIGTSLDGRASGSWGLAGCLSFHPRKVITTGEGGAILTAVPDLARRLRALRNHGLDPETITPAFITTGLNYRMTDFQAALGRSQLARLPELLEARRIVARWYAEDLDRVPVERPSPATPERHNYQSYVVLLPREVAPHRARLLDALREAGVEAAIGTHHIPLTAYYRKTYGYQPGDFPMTDEIASRAVALPMHHAIRRQDTRTVAAALAHLLRTIP